MRTEHLSASFMCSNVVSSVCSLVTGEFHCLDHWCFSPGTFDMSKKYFCNDKNDCSSSHFDSRWLHAIDRICNNTYSEPRPCKCARSFFLYLLCARMWSEAFALSSLESSTASILSVSLLALLTYPRNVFVNRISSVMTHGASCCI